MEVKCPNCEEDVHIIPSLLQIRQELTEDLLTKMSELTEEQWSAYVDQLIEMVTGAAADAGERALQFTTVARKMAATKFRAGREMSEDFDEDFDPSEPQSFHLGRCEGWGVVCPHSATIPVFEDNRTLLLCQLCFNNHEDDRHQMEIEKCEDAEQAKREEEGLL
jgi:hypothetical protein